MSSFSLKVALCKNEPSLRKLLFSIKTGSSSVLALADSIEKMSPEKPLGTYSSQSLITPAVVRNHRLRSADRETPSASVGKVASRKTLSSVVLPDWGRQHSTANILERKSAILNIPDIIISDSKSTLNYRYSQTISRDRLMVPGHSMRKGRLAPLSSGSSNSLLSIPVPVRRVSSTGSMGFSRTSSRISSNISLRPKDLKNDSGSKIDVSLSKFYNDSTPPKNTTKENSYDQCVKRENVRLRSFGNMEHQHRRRRVNGCSLAVARCRRCCSNDNDFQAMICFYFLLMMMFSSAASFE